jgi:steroid 5-alpha reductase family enzyme
MLLYGEPGFFGSWINGIVITVLFLIGLLLLKFFFYSRTGRKTDDVYQKTMKKYEKLPYNTRKFVGIFSMIVYCLAIIVLFIWVES